MKFVFSEINLFSSSTFDHNDQFMVLVEQQFLQKEMGDDELSLYRKAEITQLIDAAKTCLLCYRSTNSRIFILLLDEVPAMYQAVSLRSQIHTLDLERYQIFSRALQLVTWFKQHRYCGQCGGQTLVSQSELAVVCDECSLYFYPRISPCMMCLIIKEEECLLAHHHRQPEGMYSTLAGFVEAGESVEQTLHREVMEEVGLRVKNLLYFASQSWPFPHQLMLGYFADYESGDIIIEEAEIADAQWFRYDQLPIIPPSTTLSGQLIAAFQNRFR